MLEQVMRSGRVKVMRSGSTVLMLGYLGRETSLLLFFKLQFLLGKYQKAVRCSVYHLVY